MFNVVVGDVVKSFEDKEAAERYAGAIGASVVEDKPKKKVKKEDK